MKLKEHIEKFDDTLDESIKESSKSQLKEYIEKFDESLGEPSEKSPIPYSYTPTNEKLSTFAPIEQLQREIQNKDKISLYWALFVTGAVCDHETTMTMPLSPVSQHRHTHRPRQW